MPSNYSSFLEHLNENAPTLLLATILLSAVSQAVAAGKPGIGIAGAPVSVCADLTVCLDDKSQCTSTDTGKWICCAPGEESDKGQCVDGSRSVCANGVTVCSGAASQCTTNSGIFNQGQILCCAPGEQAIAGKCYPGNKRLIACYQDGPCDLDQSQYCAWSTSGGYSRCCKRNEYINNSYDCKTKP